MPRQVKYEAPGPPKLWGALEPYDDAPDIVKLIHWGADVIVTQKLAHEHLKAQLAYFLYAWPALEPPAPNRTPGGRDYAFAPGTNPGKDRLSLRRKPGAQPARPQNPHRLHQGRLPPGFSVEPNLLMHEVAKRERRPDAGLYFDAAYRQAEWMINNLDWNDPLVTKGQRMSEFLTITGLAHFLREYPDRAPAGLKPRSTSGPKVIVRRSDNLWDFRKLDDAKDGWTPMGEKPQMWNEPGNVIGLPAAILAAREFITPELRPRLDQLVWSHFDNMFGRNPVGRHFSSTPRARSRASNTAGSSSTPAASAASPRPASSSMAARKTPTTPITRRSATSAGPRAGSSSMSATTSASPTSPGAKRKSNSPPKATNSSSASPPR
jgi:hypothetical protein